MEKSTLNELEIAPKSVVMQTAKQFAQTLADTPQYREFEQAYQAYRQDAEAQNILTKFQTRQASLRAMLALNAVSAEDRNELKSLQDQFYNQPSVVRYARAQEDLVGLCQQIGDILSESIGIDFGSSCKTGGCCG